MRFPKGPAAPNLVCRLKKSLYGLRQASREWFAKLLVELQHQGNIQSKNDYSLFIKRLDSDLIIAAVYVDNIILTGTSISFIQSLKDHLHRTFSIKDLSQLIFFLGIEVGYSTNGITLT